MILPVEQVGLEVLEVYKQELIVKIIEAYDNLSWCWVAYLKEVNQANESYTNTELGLSGLRTFITALQGTVGSVELEQLCKGNE